VWLGPHHCNHSKKTNQEGKEKEANLDVSEKKDDDCEREKELRPEEEIYEFNGHQRHMLCKVADTVESIIFPITPFPEINGFQLGIIGMPGRQSVLPDEMRRVSVCMVIDSVWEEKRVMSSSPVVVAHEEGR
jgi:hypothetical protein